LYSGSDNASRAQTERRGGAGPAGGLLGGKDPAGRLFFLPINDGLLLAFHLQFRHQFLEVVPCAERIETAILLQTLDVVSSVLDLFTQQPHGPVRTRPGQRADSARLAFEEPAPPRVC